MTHTPRLFINHLTHAIPNSAVAFHDISLCLTQGCYGIIGDNGSGKTTLLKLLAGFIKPHQGSILCDGTLAYCPQQVEPAAIHASVVNVLGIEDKWAALQRIQQGDMHDNDVDLIAHDWGLESIVATLFRRLNLTHIPMQAAFSRLSGGEQTKVLLARTMLTQADFILLDEPTNHLDSISKNLLIDWILIPSSWIFSCKPR